MAKMVKAVECIPVLQILYREHAIEVGAARKEYLLNVVWVPLSTRELYPPAELFDQRLHLPRANRNALSLVVAIVDDAVTMLSKVGDEPFNSLVVPALEQPDSPIHITLP